ncbi:putative ABC transporter ATP-binding protein YxlF [Streptococcus constellatus]|uniref:Putative ABC transporter ATP-binding protein YxlF n=1 Tax=Streptococcus constellatus TaxID=76860 RepID=A0A564S7W6_STRCV|nr:ATP-binding cassette domain-containing protein [Streptococcus constellatus]VUW91246.1 putative ABC transporter ATP-binding protein YxlF [Streptococcus constellatus]VUX08237.1 putative ABC transporter ATP-binding protein YxlF [Streptococcus gordonii]
MTGISIKNLTTAIFQDLNFELTNPGLYGIIGPNGVGKSTLFSLLNNEIKLPSGMLKIGKVSYIPSLDIFDKHLTASDYLTLLSPEEQTVFQKNLVRMGGADYLKKKLGKYSLGMKELFAFLYALSIQSDILILDELLDGLDERRRFTAYDLLREYSSEKIILLTSHNLSEVFKVCDTVFLLSQNSLKALDSCDDAVKILFSP